LCNFVGRPETTAIATFSHHVLLLGSIHCNEYEQPVKRLEATSMIRSNLRCHALWFIASVICLLPLAGHTAEISSAPVKVLPVKSTAAKPAKTSSLKKALPKITVANFAHWSTISFNMKEGLGWLRDTTVYSLLPKQDAATLGTVAWDAVTPAQFDIEQQLFKSVNSDTRRDSLKQRGLAIGRNTQFQGGVERYWTAADHQEVAVKVGLNFNFR